MIILHLRNSTSVALSDADAFSPFNLSAHSFAHYLLTFTTNTQYMNETLTEHIKSLGFVSAEAFLRWQFTRYLQTTIAELEAEIQVYKDKYECDYATFEQRFSPEHPEVFEEWDDSITWEYLELDVKHAQEILSDLELNELAVADKDDVRETNTMLFDYYKKLEAEHEFENNNKGNLD